MLTDPQVILGREKKKKKKKGTELSYELGF